MLSKLAKYVFFSALLGSSIHGLASFGVVFVACMMEEERPFDWGSNSTKGEDQKPYIYFG